MNHSPANWIPEHSVREVVADVWLRLCYLRAGTAACMPGEMIDRDIDRDVVAPVLRGLAEWCASLEPSGRGDREVHDRRVQELAQRLRTVRSPLEVEAPADDDTSEATLRGLLVDLAARHGVSAGHLALAAAAIDPERGMESEVAFVDLEGPAGRGIAALLADIAQQIAEGGGR